MNIRMLGANVRTAMVASLSAALPGYFGALGARAFLRPRPTTAFAIGGRNSRGPDQQLADGLLQSRSAVAGRPQPVFPLSTAAVCFLNTSRKHLC